MRLTKEAYGWDPDAHFLVPHEVLEHFAETPASAARPPRPMERARAAYRAEHAEAWAEL